MRKSARTIAVAALWLVLLGAVWAQLTGTMATKPGEKPQPPASRPAQTQAPPASAKLPPEKIPVMEPFETTSGPFQLGPNPNFYQSFTVVTRGYRLKWPAGSSKHDATFNETDTAYEIRDAQGKVMFHQDLSTAPPQLDAQTGDFDNTDSVSTEVVVGKSGRALVIELSSLPSAPDACSYNQFFGSTNGKFVVFGQPTCHNLEFGPSATGVAQLMTDEKTGIEYFLEADWVGNFNLLVPRRLNFDVGNVLPTLWTIHTQGQRALCEVRMRAERQPQQQELTFIRLYAEPDGGPTPQHVVLKKDSKVEFLSAAAPCRGGRYGSPELEDNQDSDNIWVHLRADGHEGWIHTQEDFEAVGLQPAD